MSSPAAVLQELPAIKPHQKFERYFSEVKAIIHLPDGQRIITYSRDGSLRVWNLQSGEQIGDFWWDRQRGVTAIALSPDGRRVVSGSRGGAVRLWNVDTGKVIAEWMGPRSSITSVCWNQDGGQVVSGSADGTARVWDVGGRKTLLRVIKTGLEYLEAVIYSPDMTMIATGGRGRKNVYIKILDAKAGKPIAELEGHRLEVTCLAWTSDGRTLISGAADCLIRTWNTTTWQQINVMRGHANDVKSIAISPNGRILASASVDKTARLWNLENGQPISSPLQHAESVTCVSFSTDGNMVTTGGWDSSAYSWDISVIARKAGLDGLLLNTDDGDDSLLSERDASTNSKSSDLSDELPLNMCDDDKPFLDVDATQCPDQQLDTDLGVPLGFFDHSESLLHPHSSDRSRLFSSAQIHCLAEDISAHGRALLGHLSSLSRRTYNSIHDVLPRPHRLEWTGNPFSGIPHRRNHDERIEVEVQEHRPAVADISCAKGKRRNVSAAEVRLEKEKANAKKASASSLRPHHMLGVQQSGVVPQVQPTSELYVTGISTSLTTPAVAATSESTTWTTSHPDVLVIQAGRWTRFLLFIGCIWTQNPDGRH